MWSASVYHHGLDIVFSDVDPENTLISLSVSLGIGLNDNTMRAELVGELGYSSGYPGCFISMEE